VCAESKGVQALEVFEGFRKECEKESFLRRLEAVENLRRYRTFE
jgi:hypothetical protein